MRIEVLRQMNGTWLISAGAHCVEAQADDASLDAAITRLAAESGEQRNRIAVIVARRQLEDV